MTELREQHVEPAMRALLGAGGATLGDWRLRSVHRRGSASSSLLVEARIADHAERERSLLFVLHRSARPVPPGAAVVTIDGSPVHIWQFPDDPYLPGLRGAVSRRAGLGRLERLGLPVPRGAELPGIHTRSYRPTRRAVVEVSRPEDDAPALYVKVIGGRTDRRRRERTRSLVVLHDHLGARLPVPRVLEHDLDDGTIALERLDGTTLRQLLRTGGPLPPVDDVAALVEAIAGTPTPPGDNDPARYADVTRHVDLLRRQVPATAPTLDRVLAATREVGGPVGTVHGDLHDGQVLVVDGGVSGLLDVDGAGSGPLALDAGRLVANVEVAGVTVPAQAGRTERYSAALAQRLREHVPARDLALAAAAAWIGLATGPHRVRGEAWQAATAVRVERAAGWIERAARA